MFRMTTSDALRALVTNELGYTGDRLAKQIAEVAESLSREITMANAALALQIHEATQPAPGVKVAAEDGIFTYPTATEWRTGTDRSLDVYAGSNRVAAFAPSVWRTVERMTKES